ncbi:MAG: serine/threonine-protein kinase, partial [Terracidiphilus sp.]
MKTCPQCDTGYPDGQTACPIHGHLLNEIRELKPGMVIHKTYRIVRKLGQGGMGTVYLAQHILMDEPRALKFLSPELSRDQAFTGRFLREVRMLRQIRNRNVVDCGDLEAAEDDSLFFSMEFVDGPDLRGLLSACHPERPLSEVKGESKDLQLPLGALPAPLALSITRQIAEGLGAAHSKGMVHRDIKPENILMARDAGAWLPKIADFGIVATKESSTAYTRTGGTLLTMAYAAPEQWLGTPSAELDGRTDLYALGGLLYEMLTGRTPFHAENYEGWAEQHKNAAPTPPSNLRQDLANWRGLDALTLRLLAKDRNDRPANVAELLNLIDAVVYTAPKTRQATVQESRKSTKPEPQKTIEREHKQKHEQQSERKTDKTSRRPTPRWIRLVGALFVVLLGIVIVMLCLNALKKVPSNPSSEATNNVPALIQQQHNILPTTSDHPVSLLRTLKGHSYEVNSVTFSPDGRTLASGSYDRTIKLWDTASGQMLRTLQGHGGDVSSVAFSPDGRTLASGHDDTTVKLWDMASGQLLRTLHGHSYSVSSVAFSPDGRTLASGSTDFTIKFWDAASGQLLRTIKSQSSMSDTIAFSPDGRTLASGGGDYSIRLWDAVSGQLLRTWQCQCHSGIVAGIVFSPDGRTLA